MSFVLNQPKTILIIRVLILINLQERIPVEEVFEQLKCTKEGLTTEQGNSRLLIFGPNKLEEKKVHFNLLRTSGIIGKIN